MMGLSPYILLRIESIVLYHAELVKAKVLIRVVVRIQYVSMNQNGKMIHLIEE